jgi:hypothetical protein
MATLKQERFSPFFADPEGGLNYNKSLVIPSTTNTTYYNPAEVYATIQEASDRAYNIGCSGYRQVLVSSQGEYKYSPCTNSSDFKILMKEMPSFSVERRYYQYDPRENIYDIRDSFNDDQPNGFDYKGKILNRTLSNVMFRDPIKDGILQYFERVVYALVETTKQIKNFFNYTVKGNNRRVF